MKVKDNKFLVTIIPGACYFLLQTLNNINVLLAHALYLGTKSMQIVIQQQLHSQKWKLKI